MRTRCAAAAVLALLAVACQKLPPVVNVEAPPCECACSFRAVTPEIGRGCWVQGDTLVCPLAKRTLEIEPAFPSEDPRCQRQEDGTLKCQVEP